MMSQQATSNPGASFMSRTSKGLLPIRSEGFPLPAPPGPIPMMPWSVNISTMLSSHLVKTTGPHSWTYEPSDGLYVRRVTFTSVILTSSRPTLSSKWVKFIDLDSVFTISPTQIRLCEFKFLYDLQSNYHVRSFNNSSIASLGTGSSLMFCSNHSEKSFSISSVHRVSI